jgi:hypothetical protein
MIRTSGGTGLGLKGPGGKDNASPVQPETNLVPDAHKHHTRIVTQA